MVTLEQLKSKCEVLGANLTINDNCISVQLPLTKLQHKEGLSNDFLCSPSFNELQTNVEMVHKFVCDWEEKWALKNEIKRTEVSDYIRKMLATNDLWAKKALLTIYAMQTSSEQACGHTTVHNCVGFTGCDSEFMSSLAVQLQTKMLELKAAHDDWDENKLVKYAWMSAKQLVSLKKTIKKYWKQVYNSITDEVKLLKQVKAARSQNDTQS